MERNIFLRCYQYSKERFPLKNFIPLSAIFATSASVGTQAYLYGEVKSALFIFLAFSALFLFFLRLRLFDEFKDFKHDLRYYPTRPVPRGLITLKELGKVMLIVLCFEVFIATNRGVKSLMPFFIAFIYSLFMFKEFFVSGWLRRHFTIYIVSHEILLFPLFFYIFSLNGFRIYHINQSYFWLLIIFLGAQLFLLEVTRKIRPKELEIASRDTYTAQYGARGASLLVASLGLIALVFGIYTEKALFEKISPLNFISLLIIAGFLFLILRFIQKPNEINAKKVFNASIVFVLIINLVFIFNILRGL